MPTTTVPSVRPQTNIGTPNRDLWTLAYEAPNDLLGAMGLSCAGWLGLSVTEKERRLYSVNVQSFLRSRLDIPALHGLPGHRRGSIFGTEGQADPSPGSIEGVIWTLDQHCFKMQNFALARGLRPAGQAAYTSSASYTNGPTLLLAALAFAGGYATSHFLRAKRR